ncbi:hypothetical protein GLYMA_01G133700v4 [Glycine max]|uniref:Uncharacterized protein n=2 Tax=Glycine subgen. Soja TaxID=1462606 RepID=A0A0R0LAE4_SOYBN|nr:hypothetical protein JHK87_001646 [Glycine soja]KAG5069318.1 hypothetical protein JHK85_001695 [Glycine max]KAG5089042.1 hypothetical protein JHK86_001654 [Glycine max]KAH1162938.1 hypothetical protein GYH30_001453 [Glycine max]KRH76135.1 hypothetical protein GLYMA_01G133700v4 [Glycine max]
MIFFTQDLLYPPPHYFSFSPFCTDSTIDSFSFFVTLCSHPIERWVKDYWIFISLEIPVMSPTFPTTISLQLNTIFATVIITLIYQGTKVPSIHASFR